MSDLFDNLDEYEKQESGGGGIISRITFEVGYKIFVSGMSNEDTFFPLNPGNEKDKARALAEAKKALEAAGGGSRPNMAVQFRASRDDVIGREVGWQGDRFFVYPLWQDGYKKLVKPALKAAGVSKTGSYWGRISFAEDPAGTKELDQEGNERIKLLGHLVEVYSDRDAAEAAAAGQASADGGSDGSVPEGWDADSWAEITPEILDALGESPSAKEKATVAKDYDLTVADINRLIAAQA